MQKNTKNKKYLQTITRKSILFLQTLAIKITKFFTNLFNFITTKCENLYDRLSGVVKINLKKDVKVTLYAILVLIAVIFSISGVKAIYGNVSTRNFENKLLELSQIKKESIVVPELSIDDLDKIIPVSKDSLIHENQNFYMFQLTKPIKKSGENTENYNVAVYIHKPNNVLEFYMKDWYGNIITDKYAINVSLRESETEYNVDVLHLSKKDEIERLSDYVISNIPFQSYKVTSNKQIKYFLISELENSMCLVYSITQNNSDEIPNFNYMSHVIPNGHRNLIVEQTK